MAKRHNHYAKADEKYVKRTIIFSNGDDNHAFYDKECTEPVYNDEVVDLFLDGVVFYDHIVDSYYSIENARNYGEYYYLDYMAGTCYLETIERRVED